VPVAGASPEQTRSGAAQSNHNRLTRREPRRASVGNVQVSPAIQPPRCRHLDLRSPIAGARVRARSSRSDRRGRAQISTGCRRARSRCAPRWRMRGGASWPRTATQAGCSAALGERTRAGCSAAEGMRHGRDHALISPEPSLLPALGDLAATQGVDRLDAELERAYRRSRPPGRTCPAQAVGGADRT